jgi:hypothetical protein
MAQKELQNNWPCSQQRDQDQKTHFHDNKQLNGAIDSFDATKQLPSVTTGHSRIFGINQISIQNHPT